MRSYRYLIVGNSAAAVGAIEAIRRVDTIGSIAVISEEPHFAYSRPLISLYLVAEADADDLSYRPDNFYKEWNVDTILGARAKAINTGLHRVSLELGEDVGYERLLIAAGGKSVVPPIKGIQRAGVFTLNNLDNAKQIADFLPNVQRVTVIGGGFIGLQAAEALVKMGRQVTVIELSDRVLGPILDQEASSLVAQVFADRGVSILTSATAQEILGQDDNSPPNGVRLEDGAVIPTDMVIVAVGVIPRTELVEGGAIKADRGILVDDHMETTVKGIFAAGDVAEGKDLLTGHRQLRMTWLNASSQGRFAGLNMAGYQARFRDGIAMDTAHFLDLYVASVGIHTPSDDGEYRIMRDYRPKDKFYKKLVLKAGKMVGLIGVGKPVDKSGVICGLIRAQVDARDFAQRLFKDWGV